jgi:hypothetical protein
MRAGLGGGGGRGFRLIRSHLRLTLRAASGHCLLLEVFKINVCSSVSCLSCITGYGRRNCAALDCRRRCPLCQDSSLRNHVAFRRVFFAPMVRQRLLCIWEGDACAMGSPEASGCRRTLPLCAKSDVSCRVNGHRRMEPALCFGWGSHLHDAGSGCLSPASDNV